jgi:hypothetical protein
MRKTLGKNKHQKAAHRPGERKISRAQVAELLTLSCSVDADERLVAAQYMCPCHIRGHIPQVWAALYRMMEDEDRRVRFAAWHTLEDGGVPGEPEALALLERILSQESDPKIRAFAERIIGVALAARNRQEWRRLDLGAGPAGRLRGKCDFCGAREVPVERDLETMIPTDGLPRPALVCERCARGGR